jgi:hypothetical protein
LCFQVEGGQLVRACTEQAYDGDVVDHHRHVHHLGAAAERARHHVRGAGAFFHQGKKNYSKEVKEHCVQQAQFLSTNHHVVLSWCAQALAFIELTVDNVNSQDFNVSFAVLLSVRNLL